MTNRAGRTRCGAIRIQMSRSASAACVRRNARRSSANRSPWTKRPLALEAALARSPCSIRMTLRPRPAASRATLTPFRPPPMIARSKSAMGGTLTGKTARCRRIDCFESAGLARRLDRVPGWTADQPVVLIDRKRLADEVALDGVAALLGEEGKLLLGFHALGDDRHFEAVTKTDDRANDRRRLRAAAEIHDEGAVDLDLVERECLQIAQRRVAAAEIVHRNAHAKALQPAQ